MRYRAAVGSQFEILADCPICLCEGSVIELYDPNDVAASLGIAADARCRLCSAWWRAQVTAGPGASDIRARGTGKCPGCAHALMEIEVQSHACGQCGTRARQDLARNPEPLGDRGAVERALLRFALEEHERDVLGFVASNFTAGTIDGVLASIVRRDVIETSFAAMHTLFNRHGGRGGANKGGGGNVREQRESRAPETLGAGMRLPVPAPPAYDTRAMMLALVSVVVADGEIDPGERAFIERFAAREQIAAATDDEYVMHRPVELAGRVPPDRRRELLETMTELACLDGVTDSSEIRIVRAYASMWGIDDDAIGEWIAKYQLVHATRARRFFLRVKDFFLAPPPADQDERTANKAAAPPPAG